MKRIDTPNFKQAMPWPRSKPMRSEPHSRGAAEVFNFLQQQDADKINQEHGDDIEYIGSGNYGMAYRTPKDKVVKITRDPSEANTVKNLQHNPNNTWPPCVVPIDKVEKVDGLSKGGWEEDLWVIEGKYVKPLPDDERSTLNAITEIYFQRSRRLPTIDWIAERVWGKVTPRIQAIYDRYKALLDCLKAHGVPTQDAGPRNIGVDEQGNYVLFDLGNGTS